MNTHQRTILLGCLSLAALLLALMPAAAGPAPSSTQQPAPTAAPDVPVPAPSVKLSASPVADSFSSGSSIGIAVTLTNQGPSAVGLSNIVDGNLVITAIVHEDGSSVATVPTMTNYLNGFPAALSSSLVSVAPGSSLALTWTSDFNQTFGGEALLENKYTGADIGPGTYYDLSKPGSYAITFHYHYQGPTSSFPGTVFKAKTNSVTVRLHVN